MVQAAIITFVIGMLLILAEYMMARKKKGGVSPTDKKRMVGLFWLSCMAAGLIAGLIWLSD